MNSSKLRRITLTVSVLLSVALAACGAPPAEEVAVSDAVLTTFIRCTGPVYPDGAAGRAVYVRHDTYRFSDGSAFASCAVKTGSTETEGVSLHRAEWTSAATGECFVSRDLLEPASPAGYWRFALNDAGTASFGTYRDDGSRYDYFTASVSCRQDGGFNP